MAKNYGFLVCILVLVLDVAAGILGIQAEIAENKVYIRILNECWWEKRTLSFHVLGWKQVKDLKMWALECRDPSFGAFKLGVAASILLAFAHAFAHLLGGCICMRSKEECERATANRQLAVSFLLLSWYIYVFYNTTCHMLRCWYWSGVDCRIVLAIAFSLLILVTLANSRSREWCGISNRRFLSIGGILCFVHGLFTIVYYVSVTATRREEKRPGNPIVSHP